MVVDLPNAFRSMDEVVLTLVAEEELDLLMLKRPILAQTWSLCYDSGGGERPRWRCSNMKKEERIAGLSLKNSNQPQEHNGQK